VDKVVQIESTVGVPADKIIQSNLWMLQTAAAESKTLSVVGNLDITQAPAGFAQQVAQQQVAQLSANKQWVGIRIGGGVFQSGMPQSLSSLKPNVLTNLKRRLRLPGSWEIVGQLRRRKYFGPGTLPLHFRKSAARSRHG
jgi:hypothetical protein